MVILGRPTVQSAALLAHQGGWDEILLVAGPIVVIVGLLMLARKRVDK
jgi:sugar phosphate permease